MGLELYYAGDSAWNLFVLAHREQSMYGDAFNHVDFKFLPPMGPEVSEILEVAVSYFGTERTKSWLAEVVPALEGETPDACLFENASLAMIIRMREYLLRLPV
jgi:hypothetical protein